MFFTLFFFFHLNNNCTNGRKAICHRKMRPHEKPIAVVTSNQRIKQTSWMLYFFDIKSEIRHNLLNQFIFFYYTDAAYP